MPPSAMMPPASTKNGIASSAKSSVPSEILSMTASSGMSAHIAAMRADSPSAYATGTPSAHSTANDPSRIRISIAYSSSAASSRYMTEVLGGVPIHTRSIRKSNVTRPLTGIGA